MSQSEREFIRENARRLQESQDSPRPFSDPFDDMSSEEKSKLILMLQDMVANANDMVAKANDMVAKANREAEDKDKENKEIIGKLNAVLEGQASSKIQIKELNATIRKLTKELEKKEKLIADLQDRLSRRNSDLFGSKSQKGGTTRKAPA